VRPRVGEPDRLKDLGIGLAYEAVRPRVGEPDRLEDLGIGLACEAVLD
jgi:hypothetical protein